MGADGNWQSLKGLSAELCSTLAYLFAVSQSVSYTVADHHHLPLSAALAFNTLSTLCLLAGWMMSAAAAAAAAYAIEPILMSMSPFFSRQVTYLLPLPLRFHVRVQIVSSAVK